MHVIGAGGTAPVTGDGHATASRTAPTTASRALDRRGSTTSSASTRRVPANTTAPPTTNWQQGPGHRPADRRRRRRLARAHGVARRRRLLDHRATRRPSPARARTSSRPPPSTPPATAPSATTPCSIDDTLPGRHDRHRPSAGRTGPSTSPSTAPTRTPASTASSGSSTRSRSAPAPTAPSVHDRHARPAQLPHPRRSTRSATRARGPTTHVWVDIHGPADTTVIPTGWITDPSTVDQHHRRRQRRPRHPAHPVASSTAPRPATSSAPTPTPVTVTGDGVHKLEVRITDDLGPRPRLAHAPGQDRHRQPGRQHDRRGRLAPARPTSTCSCAAPTRTRRSRASSGASTAATSLSASANNHEVRVAGNGVHTLETRDRRQRRPRAAPGRRTRSSSTPTLPTNTHPGRSRGLAQHALLGRAQRHRRRAPAWPRSTARIQLEGEPAGAEHEGTRNVDPRRDRPTTARTRSSTRVRDNAGNYSAWRAETIRIDRVAADRRHGLSVGAPVGNRHVVTFNPQDDRSGVAGVEWKLDGGAVKTTADGHDHRRGRAHAVRARAGQRRQLERLGRPHDHGRQLGLDTTAPTDTTVDPDARGSSAPTRSTVTADRRHRRHRRRLRPVALRRQPDRPGPERQRVHDHRGRRARDRDARGRQGRQRLRLAPPDAADRHARQPTDTTVDRRRGWTNPQHVHAAARPTRRRASPASSTRSTTAAPVAGRRRHHRHAPGRRRLPRSPPRARQRRPVPRAGRSTSSSVDTVLPVQHERRRADDVADERAVARADRHRRRVRRRPRASGAWTAATIQTGTPPRSSHRGHADARDADRRQGRQRLRPGARRPSGSTAPSRSTRRRAPTAPWRKTNFTTTVTGTDATPGSGVPRDRVQARQRLAVTTTPASRSRPRARTSSTRAWSTSPATRPTGATDTIGIDKTVPTLAVDCGRRRLAQQRRPTCTVSGRRRRLRPADADRRARRRRGRRRIGGSLHRRGRRRLDRQLPRRRRRRQRDDRPAPTVKIDRTPPAAAVTCAPGAGTTLGLQGRRAPTRSPALTGLSWSVDGSAADADRQRRHVQRRQGHGRGLRDRRRRQRRRVRAGHARRPHAGRRRRRRRTTDRRADAALHERGRPAAQGRRAPPRACSASSRSRRRRPGRPSTCARSRSARARSSSSVKVTTGKKSKTFTKTQTTKKGYSTRISVSASAAADGHGHADRQPQVRQALGHLRQRRAPKLEVTRRVDVPRSLATIVRKRAKGACPCPERPGSSSSPTRPPRPPR